MKKLIIFIFSVVLLGSCQNVGEQPDLVLNSPEFYEIFGYGDEGFKNIFNSRFMDCQKQIFKSKKGKPYSGNVLIYSEISGHLKSKISFKDGQRDGLTELYNTKGKIKLKGQFKNGLCHGSVTQFNKDGSIKKEATFINGEKQ